MLGTMIFYGRRPHFVPEGHFVSFEVFWLVKICIFIWELAHKEKWKSLPTEDAEQTLT